ncbi:SusD/RagB family nutrient-binding outer membrane lipoprotein [Mucilaginibacter ginkgonis]|uniref:SusD/RagB family nutrient-binding outer membrane lipoprotein n=1 Tax=Mucilaginibacter ginkgonis TaxID=2682091 RepID=A0A6I4I0L8_9SPHI|nr:SusD/RagB family nutrient-binding outer membrane lipoprotein [Mucilaginibacter ginkgonis]QQL49009.1 SusD/RagB family nutrient-binding outer membrane lipoprotein [Mucilaginibacter ginkgonis]
MKKLLYIVLPALLVITSCKKNLTDLNVNPKSPTTVPAAGEFTGAEHTFANILSSASVNLNIFRLIEQQWQETTYTDESNYDINTRPIPDAIWNAFYRDALENFEQAKKLGAADPASKVNNAMVDVMEVYSYYYLTTTFGNVPYSQALNPDNLFPVYDDALTVYKSLLTRLDADITALGSGTSSFGAADLLYGGSATQWKKAAATLKLKMAITLSDADNATAKAAAESAATAGLFTSNADNMTFAYLSAPPNTNPVWVDLVQSGRQDFVANTVLVTTLKSLNDPRLSFFFTTDANGGYSGAAPGASANYSAFSKPSTTITQQTYPGLLLSYSEMQFDLAEAVERGYNVGGTAAAHYNEGVTASITFWGGTAAQATTYLAQPTVAYATAAGTYKQKIGIQKWISFYNRGWDAWINQRRLDYPVLTAPATARTAFPVRFTYPVQEGNVNGPNFTAAGAAIGGNTVTTKLFFDKF